MNEELIEFVEHARQKGLDYVTIRHLLSSRGWKEKEIAEAICTRDLELPIPSPPAGRSVGPVRLRGRLGSAWPRMARDALLHLLTFGALYTWATSLILLFFT